MSEIMYCFISTTGCIGEQCPLFHDASEQCKAVMAINKILGDIDGPIKKAPPKTPESQIPVVEAMIPEKQFPELKSGTFLPKISGRIVDAPETREVNTKDGPKPVTNFRLTDGAIQVRVGLWEALGDQINNFNIGDFIILTSMSVRDPYDGEAQISSTRKTKITR